MSTATHFVPLSADSLHHPSTITGSMFHAAGINLARLEAPRFQVVLAGNAFFHIKEISTGHVRGFRSNHNEACALARALELRG